MVSAVGREFGRMIREARRSQRLTQARLASRVGVSRETVYRVERGRLPSADVGARLCDYLDIDRLTLDQRHPQTDAIKSHPEVTLLRHRRRHLSLTLAQCAAAAGVSEATLSRFERGIEGSRSLARFDVTGRPCAMVNEGLAGALGFESVGELDEYWRTGRVPAARSAVIARPG